MKPVVLPIFPGDVPVPGQSKESFAPTVATSSSAGGGSGSGGSGASSGFDYYEDFSFLPDVTEVDGVGDAWYNEPAPAIAAPAVTAPTAVAPSVSSGFDWNAAIANVTNAAFAILKVQTAYRAAREPQIRTVSVGANGITRTGNTDGTVTLRDASGNVVGNEKPTPGIPYALPDGSVIMNNGNGTYTLINPAGVRSIKSYSALATAAPVIDGFGSNTGMVFAAVAIGLGLLFVARRGR